MSETENHLKMSEILQILQSAYKVIKQVSLWILFTPLKFRKQAYT